MSDQAKTGIYISTSQPDQYDPTLYHNIAWVDTTNKNIHTTDSLGAEVILAFGVTSANNGASLSNASVILGQIVGTLGDPAKLLSDIEIPNPTDYKIYIGRNDDNDTINNIVLSSNHGISFNNYEGTGSQILAFTSTFYGAQYDVRSKAASIYLDFYGGGTAIFDNPYSGVISFNNNNTQRFDVTSATMVFGNGYGAITNTISGDQSISGGLYLIDSSAGNIALNITPTQKNIIDITIILKKISSDTNTITLTLTSGLIYKSDGTTSTTYVISSSGKSVTFHGNGTNLYVINELI